MEIGKISSQRQQSLSSSVQALGKHIAEADTSFSAELNDQLGTTYASGSEITRNELEKRFRRIQN